MAVFILNRLEIMYQFTKPEKISSVVCSGTNLFIYLIEPPPPDRPYSEDPRQCKFVLEVVELKSKVKDRFRMVNRRRYEHPKLLAVGPSEKHLLVYTSESEGRVDGWIYIFRMSSKGKLSYQSCIDIMNFEHQLENLSCLNFHGYMKTKFIFSGFTAGSGIGLFTVVYDFRSKKVLLVRLLKTRLSTVRNLSLLGTCLHGVDDHCKKFELRI